MLFNGDQRLNEPPAKKRTDGKEQIFEDGDVLSFTLDLGFSDTLKGRWHVKINGQNLTHCDGVQGIYVCIIFFYFLFLHTHAHIHTYIHTHTHTHTHTQDLCGWRCN